MGSFAIFYHQVYTVVVMVLFIGIWVWAWSGKRKKAFHDASLLPLADDLAEAASTAQENRHD